MVTKSTLLALGLALFLSALPVLGQDVHPPRELVKPPKKAYSPFVDDHFPTRVLFGDTHLHTSWSADVGMAGRSWRRCRRW